MLRHHATTLSVGALAAIYTLGLSACANETSCPPGAHDSVFCRGDAGPMDMGPDIPTLADGAVCMAAAPCLPAANPCHSGMTTCAPVDCIDTGMLRPAGSDCGSGLQCDAAGNCSVCLPGATCN